MNPKKFILVCLLVLCYNLQVFGQSFSREAVLQDLEYLKSSLEDAHYNLYALTPKPDFDKNFQEVKNSVQKDSFNFKEATGIFQRVIAKAQTGHAEIDFPAKAYIPYAKQGGTLFPFELALENGKALVRKNFSDDQRISPGSELLTINGRPIEEILERIYLQLSAERAYFRKAKLEFWSFPRLYWQVYGEQKEFRVELLQQNKRVSYHIQAVKALEGFEYKRKDVFDFSAELEFFGDTAYLYPGPFSSQQEQGEKTFQKFIDSSFTKIQEKASKNLIVDLRYNTGGHDAFSNYLIAWFADKPFKWNSEFRIKTSKFLKEHTRKHNDTTNDYFKAILKHKNGETYSYDTGTYSPVPAKKRYKGKVYVLVNRQTHSMAAVSAALIQDYGFATVVGEETAEYPNLHASQFSYSLLNTGVLVKVPKGYIIRPSGKNEKKGVVPDLTIKDHLLDEQDEILDGLLQQLEEKN